MDRRCALTFGLTGQVVEFYPPEGSEGVPSAASVSVWRGEDDNDDAAELTPSVTVDSTNILFDAASGFSNHDVSRRRCFLASVSGVAQRRKYIVQNAFSEREIVRVEQISTSAPIGVDVEHDLVHDYAAGSSFLGLRISWTVDSTWIADEDNLNDYAYPFRILWTYTIAGVVRKHWTYADVVRVAKQHGVTVESLLGEWPSLWHQLPQSERLMSADRLITAAWRRVEDDLRLNSIDPNTVREGGLLDRLVSDAAMEVLARRGQCPPGRDLEQFVRESSAIYHRDFVKAIGGNRIVRSDSSDTATISAEPARPGWFVS